MTIKKKVSVWFVSLKVLEATFCVGVKTKLPTRNPVCLRETPVKVCRQKIPGTALTHYGLLIQMQNISLRSSGISRNFLSSPSFFAFPVSFLFSCWAFSRLHFGGQMEQDFHGDFQVNVTWFFAFFSGVLD